MISFNFGGRVAIHPGEALYYIGYSRTLEGAKKNRAQLDIAQRLSIAAHFHCSPAPGSSCHRSPSFRRDG